MPAWVVSSAVLLVVAGLAAAEPVGAQDPTQPPARPKLVVKDSDAVQIVRFDDSRDAKSATLSIGIDPAPQDDAEPPPPRGALQGDLISEENRRLPSEGLKIVSITWDGVSSFRAKLEITPGKDIKPGRYTGTVSFGGSRFAAPVPVSVVATLRSDLEWAALLAVLGWFAGVLLKGATDLFSAPGNKIRSKASIKKYFKRSGFIATAALGLVGAGAAWGFTYFGSDVWGAADLDDIELFGTALACVVTGTTLADFFKPFKGTPPPPPVER